MSAIEMIAVGKLKLADDNVRADVGDVSELAASIKTHGVIEPLIANSLDSVVVCGARRLVAAKKAGLKEVPVILRPFTEQERVETMIVENLQREGLTPLEEADAYRRLVELGLTQRDVAARVGRSQSLVAKRLSLLVLPAEVQKKVDSGGIKLEDAQELAKLKDDPKLVTKLAKEGPMRITHSVGAELAKRDREKKAASAVKTLEKKGETVVKLTTDAYGYNPKPPKGMAMVVAQSWKEGVVVMAPAAHKKLACHAVGVDPRSLDVLEVCTDPKKHPDPAVKLKAEKERKEAEVKAAEEKRGQVIERRRDWLKAAIAGKPDKDVVLELCWLALLSGNGWSGYQQNGLEIAVALAAIEPTEQQWQESEGDLDFEELLHAKATVSDVDRLRVIFAIAAAQVEEAVSRSRLPADTAVPYLRLLEKHGYQLHEAELDAIAPYEAEAAEDVAVPEPGTDAEAAA